MKKFIPLFILFLIQYSVQAQDLVAEQASVNVDVLMDGANYYEFIDFTNNSSTDMEVEWARVTNDLPDGWLAFICIEGGSCYNSTTDASPAGEDWVIPAGESRWLEVQFRADAVNGTAVEGTGTVVLSMTDKNNANNTASATWVGTASVSPVKDLEQEDIKIFPNPASNFIKLSNSSIVEQIEVFNLIGRKVKTFFDVAEGSLYNIADLPKGIYMIRMLDADNETLVTKRISKR